MTNFYAVSFFQRHVAGRNGYNRYLTPGHVRKEDLPVQFFQVRSGGRP